MDHAIQAVVDLLGSLLELLVELIRLGLIFVLKKLGYSEADATKITKRIGWLTTGLFAALLFFLTIRYGM